MKFRKNDTITLNETETIVVKDFLGDGGQGEVIWLNIAVTNMH